MICSLIVAASANDVIGRDGALPWHLPGDLRRFRALTTGRAVVIGRVTHESIVARLGHPLAGRTSVVVSRSAPETGDGAVVPARSVEAALEAAARLTAEAGEDEFYVAGGESVYRQALPRVDRVYLTRVHLDVSGDRRMPADWLAGFALASSEDVTDPSTGTGYSWLGYRRAPS